MFFISAYVVAASSIETSFLITYLPAACSQFEAEYLRFYFTASQPCPGPPMAKRQLDASVNSIRMQLLGGFSSLTVACISFFAVLRLSQPWCMTTTLKAHTLASAFLSTFNSLILFIRLALLLFVS